MSFPTRLLGPGRGGLPRLEAELVLIVLAAVFTVLVLAGCVAAVVLWTSAPLSLGWVLLGVRPGRARLLLGLRYLAWRTTTFVVTSQRIVYRTGVLRRTGQGDPDRPRAGRDLSPDRSSSGSCRAGSLTVESAGRHGQDPFPDISRPAEVQSLINRGRGQGLGG